MIGGYALCAMGYALLPATGERTLTSPQNLIEASKHGLHSENLIR